MTTIWEIILGGLIVIGRVLSHFEHKKTGKQITEIKISINGEIERRMNEAREQGRQEERNKNKPQ